MIQQQQNTKNENRYEEKDKNENPPYITDICFILPFHNAHT